MRGRFVRGMSGNPSGRPPGILNEATRTAAVLLGGEAGALTRKAIELALAGDLGALRLCLDRIIAPQREAPAAFALPRGGRGGRAVADGVADEAGAALGALVRAAASGEVTPMAAASLAQVLETQARVGDLAERRRAERVAARHDEIAPRLELRVTVMMAHEARAFYTAGRLCDPALQDRCREMLRIGNAALATLRAIPDTPALLDADMAYLAAHPLPQLRASVHPLALDMRQAWERVADWLDQPGRVQRIEAQLAALAATQTADTPTGPAPG